MHTIATKAPEVLHLLIQSGNYVRPLLAETAAFEALIPVVKAEKESGICGNNNSNAKPKLSSSTLVKN